MTTTTQNDAAERLYAIFASNVVLEAQVDQVIADIAAAERRATVERIHYSITTAYMEGDDRAEAFPLKKVYAILDEEAAR